MQITLRSYLTAGTVAVVGAGAIAMTPVLVDAPLAVPAPAVAEISLTGLDLSLTDVVGLLQGFGIGGVLPDFLTSLPSLLPTDIVSAVVAEFVNQVSPLALTAAGQVFDYLGAAVAGLISGPDSIPARFGDALAAIPEMVAAAFQTLGTGDLATALKTLTDGLAGPFSGIAAVLSEAAEAFGNFVASAFDGLVTTLPAVLLSAVQTVLGGNLQSLIDSVGTALSELFGGFLPGAGAAVAPAAASLAVAGDGPAARAAVSVAVSAPEETATTVADESPAEVAAPRSRSAAKAAATDSTPAPAAADDAAAGDSDAVDAPGAAASERGSSAKAGAQRAASR